MIIWGRDTAQVVECLYGMHKALGSSSGPHKQGIVVHAHNTSTWKVEGVSEVRGHLRLFSEFQGHLRARETLSQ